MTHLDIINQDLWIVNSVLLCENNSAIVGILEFSVNAIFLFWRNLCIIYSHEVTPLLTFSKDVRKRHI